MYLARISSETYEFADQATKRLVAKLLEGFSLPAALSRDNPGDLLAAYPGRVLLLVSGSARLESDGRTLCHYDDGDLVGVAEVMGMLKGRLVADSLIDFQPIEWDALWAHVQSSSERQALWSRWLVGESVRSLLALGQCQQEEHRPAFGVRHFAEGEMMIRQGSEPDEVYAILQGSAEVLHNGTRVGEVLAQEIFGAMAFLTGQPRSADVIAREACSVMVVPGADFQQLLQSHPHIGMNLLRSMARQVAAMNRQVHDLLHN